MYSDIQNYLYFLVSDIDERPIPQEVFQQYITIRVNKKVNDYTKRDFSNDE